MITRFLLRILNSRWLNGTPARYGHINGLDAISYQELQNEDQQQPGITIHQLLIGIDAFRACAVRPGVTVIEPDGTTRDADVWDMQDIRELGKDAVR